MIRRLLPFLSLSAVALLFFWPLVFHPTKVFYSPNSDALAQHIPYKMFLVRSWRETGEIPLWCPNSIGGAPFITDAQVSVWYPPNLLLLAVPERWVPPAFCWLIVIQVIAGGMLTFQYARQLGLQTAGAWVAGCGFMLSGKWMVHLLAAGHTILIGLVWLPLVLLCFERALYLRRASWAAAAGAALSLVILGTHPQWTLYAGLFFIVWTLAAYLATATTAGMALALVGRYSFYGLLMGFIALALAAIQLLPTYEAMQYSCRQVLGVAHHSGNVTGLRAAWPAWLGLVGPSVTTHPDWENTSGIGLLWAMAAVGGAWLGGRRWWPRYIAVALVFAFALTGGLGFHEIPIFSLFRGPSRMLMFAVLPLALFAGIFADYLPLLLPRQANRLAVLLGGVAVIAIVYTEGRIGYFASERRYFHFYWPTLALTVPFLFFVIYGQQDWISRRRIALFCLVMLADLFALSWPFVHVHRAEYVYQSSPTFNFLVSRRDDLGRVLDVHPYDSVSPFGCGAPMALNLGLHPVRGYNPLDFYRYKKYLQMISEGNEPHAPHEIVDGFFIQNRALFDLLGVRYLLQPVSGLPPGDNWTRVFEHYDAQVCYNYPGAGMITLEPFTVYENEQAFPRAFVVPQAKPMPASDSKHALLTTNFRETVLVEGGIPEDSTDGPAHDFHPADVLLYRPNEIRLRVDGEHPGWLVLADMWYPGWTATVDGQEKPIFRGNYLFRTLHLDAGTHEVVLRFLPPTFVWGRRITLFTLLVLAGWAAAAAISRRLAFQPGETATFTLQRKQAA